MVMTLSIYYHYIVQLRIYIFNTIVKLTMNSWYRKKMEPPEGSNLDNKDYVATMSEMLWKQYWPLMISTQAPSIRL